jgi:ribosomal protein S18 acetylase RimI-like enzyme
MSDPSRHLTLPPGYSLRAPSPADAGPVADLKRAVEVERQADSDVTVDLVREEWALPRLSMDDDLWIVEDVAGSVVGYGLCWVEAPPGDIVADQTVDPRHRGHGLSEILLVLGEARAAELLRAAGPEADGTLGVWAHESDVRRLELLARRGYRREHTFLRLERDLHDGLEAPVWPQGIEVGAFRRGVDEAVVHAAHDEVFLEGSGPAETDLEEWLQSRFAHEGVDLDLWLIAWDQGEVVGGIEATETPSGAYMGDLFVRRAWRGRGIGRALMLRECGELRRRGVRTAYFAVDTANPTGALDLFESMGFRSARGATHLFEKTLAGS